MKYLISLLTSIILLSVSCELLAITKAEEIKEFSTIVKSGKYACDEQFAVLFGNGFRANEASAKDSILVLQKLVEVAPKLVPDLKKKTTYNNIYNSTHLFGVGDAAEIILQKPGAEISQMLQHLAGDSLAPNWFQKLLRRLLIANNNIRSNLLGTTQSHVQIYNSLLAKGRQIAPVTHSQGNLFINEAYNGIHESLKQGMGIVSVANPDDVVADQDQRHAYENTRPFLTLGDVFYLNVLEDEVMDWLGSGDMNFDNYIDVQDAPHDSLGHSFIKVYLDTNATHKPNAAKVIVDETIARHDKTTSAKCRTAFFSPPNDLQQWHGKKSKRIIDKSGQAEAINYPTHIMFYGLNVTLLDWKGAYVNGVATKSISYPGPPARFMAAGGGKFGNHIYRDGQIFYVAPTDHVILGAALTVDSNNQEWVVAITGEESDSLGRNYVWRRKVKKIQDLTVQDFNNATTPDPDPTKAGEPYWEKLNTLFNVSAQSPDKTSTYTGWFFNGDGTEAQTIRWKEINYDFGDNSCSHKKICLNSYSITRKVNVLERHRVRLIGDNFTVYRSNLGYETGDTGVVGVDYLDDEELILRIKNTRSIGDNLNVPVDESTWLEINGEPLMDSRILQCNQDGLYACRPWIFDTEILQGGHGMLLNMHALESGYFDHHYRTDIGTGDKITQRNLIHLYHLDMRTKTFEFSTVNNTDIVDQIKAPNVWPTKVFGNTTGIDANYYFSHNNEDPVLIGTVHVNKQNVLQSKASYSHTYGDYSNGRAGSFGNMHIGTYLVPPIRGQYRRNNHALVPPMPIQMGRVVDPDGALLLSYELPGDIFFNYYSKGNIEALAGTSLNKSTVLPLGLN